MDLGLGRSDSALLNGTRAAEFFITSPPPPPLPSPLSGGAGGGGEGSFCFFSRTLRLCSSKAWAAGSVTFPEMNINGEVPGSQTDVTFPETNINGEVPGSRTDPVVSDAWFDFKLD